MDAIALTECAGTGDETAARAILRNMDAPAVAARLARLLSQALADAERGMGPCRECFRDWLAGSRP